jgi:hypothetical protein
LFISREAGRFFKIMGLHQELPVYKPCYDLLLKMFRLTKDFARIINIRLAKVWKREKTKPTKH